MGTLVEKYSHWVTSSLYHRSRESGMTHIAEGYLKVLVGLPGGYDEITRICQHKHVGSDVLACLSSITPVPGSVEWRVGLVTASFNSEDTGVLDSAIDVCAVWGEDDREIFDLLESRVESLPQNWLKCYAKDVIKDLTEHWDIKKNEKITAESEKRVRSFVTRPPEDIIAGSNLTQDQLNANISIMLAKLDLMDARYLEMCYNLNPETNAWSVTFKPKVD